jgi:hypothetical protein
VRIEADVSAYLPKGQLWNHLDSFYDNLVYWLNTPPRMPDFINSHYVDAGYVGVHLANLLDVSLCTADIHSVVTNASGCSRAGCHAQKSSVATTSNAVSTAQHKYSRMQNWSSPVRVMKLTHNSLRECCTQLVTFCLLASASYQLE